MTTRFIEELLLLERRLNDKRLELIVTGGNSYELQKTSRSFSVKRILREKFCKPDQDKLNRIIYFQQQILLMVDAIRNQQLSEYQTHMHLKDLDVGSKCTFSGQRNPLSCLFEWPTSTQKRVDECLKNLEPSENHIKPIRLGIPFVVGNTTKPVRI